MTQATLTFIPSFSIVGITGIPIEVEVDKRKSDALRVVVVGLPDAAVREARDRVLSALTNAGFSLPVADYTINLAPGDVKKEGPLYDLPIGLAMLSRAGLLPSTILDDYLCVGELALSGKLRPIRGALLAALLAKEQGLKGIVLPKENAPEAAAIHGLDVIGVESLGEAAKFFESPSSEWSFKPIEKIAREKKNESDFQFIQGQTLAKRGMEIAAAGGHNILLYGPPGTGKTLLARALASILPPLEHDEALEVTKIHSISGIHSSYGLVDERPFRAPHHTVSHVGLVGGGGNPKPGEISLAHHGVLFLDELPEFSRKTLEVLRQPLEDGKITISRSGGRLTFPTRCMLVCAMNPCPCGYLGHPKKPCRDSELQIESYRSKISGPLLDRIDITIEVPFQDLDSHTGELRENSSTIRQRVIAARSKQQVRFHKTNSAMTVQDVETFCALSPSSHALMRDISDHLGLSRRGSHRLLKVARTIADLENSEAIEDHHLLEASSLKAPINN